jgi:hypothetical protein
MASSVLSFLGQRFLDVVAEQPRWEELRARLLELGGEDVAARYEEDLDSLLELGCLREGESQENEGLPCNCHGNAARLWEQDPANVIVTGWALSDDALWRQHSWCEHDSVIIETTTPRRAYYGFALDDEAATVFAHSNF